MRTADRSSKAIQCEYGQRASHYDQLWKGYLTSTHHAALELLSPQPGDVILDASGGTGLLAEQIADATWGKANVVVTDVSKEMLKIASERPYRGIPTQCVQGDVHALAFADGNFNKVVSVSAFHHYADPEQALTEFYRVLMPRGTLVLVDWCRDSIYFKIFDAVFRSTHKAHVKTYTTGELEHLLEEKDFTCEKAMRWRYGAWYLVGVLAEKRGNGGGVKN